MTLEVQKDVVRDRDRQWIRRAVRGARGVVHLPRDALRLELFGHRSPRGAPDRTGSRIGDDHRATFMTLGVERPRPSMEPVRVRRSHDRAVIAVADGEGVRQRVPELQIGTGVVAHGEHTVLRALPLRRRVGGDELVHQTPVPTHVLGRPLMGKVEGAFGRGVGRVEMEGQQLTGRAPRPRLGEGARRSRCPVIESPDTFVCAEVMVERAVLVHEKDHVLDRTDVDPAGAMAAALRAVSPPHAARARPKAPAMPATSTSRRVRRFDRKTAGVRFSTPDALFALSWPFGRRRHPDTNRSCGPQRRRHHRTVEVMTRRAGAEPSRSTAGSDASDVPVIDTRAEIGLRSNCFQMARSEVAAR